MSRSAWGVIVATLFTIATWATPVPEEWRWPLIFLAWFSLAISIIGWLLTHYQATGRIQLTRKVRTPMVTIIIFIACGSIGAIAWRLLPVSESKPKSGPQPASTTAAQQTPDSRAPAAVSATTKLVDPHPDRQTHKSTLRSPDLQIIYEDKLPYNEMVPVLNEQRADIGIDRHIGIGLRNVSHKTIEGVSLQMLGGIAPFAPRPLLPQQMRVRNRAQPVFDVAPDDLVVVEIVSKRVVWNKSGKEWTDAGIDLVFHDKPFKISSGRYILKFQVSARNLAPQYIWLMVSDWQGKAEWKISRLPEGAEISHMDGTTETISLHGSKVTPAPPGQIAPRTVRPIDK